MAAAPRARAKAETGTPGSLDLTGDGGPFRSGGRRREGARGIGDLGFCGRAAGCGYRDRRRGKENRSRSGGGCPARCCLAGGAAKVNGGGGGGEVGGRWGDASGSLKGWKGSNDAALLCRRGVRGGRSDFRRFFFTGWPSKVGTSVVGGSTWMSPYRRRVALLGFTFCV
jgi:hypothetical protein